MTPPPRRSAGYSPTRRADCSTLGSWASKNSFCAGSKPISRKLWPRRARDFACVVGKLPRILAGEGRAAYERCQEEAAADHVFGVPFFLFAGEPFWGYDRLALLEQRLEEAGLAIGDKVTAA